jgi:hypothetical protein
MRLPKRDFEKKFSRRVDYRRLLAKFDCWLALRFRIYKVRFINNSDWELYTLFDTVHTVYHRSVGHNYLKHLKPLFLGEVTKELHSSRSIDMCINNIVDEILVSLIRSDITEVTNALYKSQFRDRIIKDFQSFKEFEERDLDNE